MTGGIVGAATEIAGTYSNSSSDSGGAAVFAIVYILFILVFAAAQIAGMWKAFDKAGEPGWAAIVPFYNLWIIVKLSQKESWWFILFLIPCVNTVAAIVVYMALAEQYGKEAVWGLGLAFIPVIFWPMLGFGDAQYRGAPAAGGYAPQA